MYVPANNKPSESENGVDRLFMRNLVPIRTWFRFASLGQLWRRVGQHLIMDEPRELDGILGIVDGEPPALSVRAVVLHRPVEQ